MFRFAGPSWVEVRDASGAVIYSGTNGPGSSRAVQGKPPFAIVVGNARDVKLEYQGKPFDLVPHIRVSVARLTVQ
jgi:cytoskeleton protein RodZ